MRQLFSSFLVGAILITTPAIAISADKASDKQSQKKSVANKSRIVNGKFYSKQQWEAEITKIEDYLNGLTTVKAAFTQTGINDQVSTGTFYLSRPGKLRWEYNAPPPVIIVVKGGNVTYYDSELNEISHVTTSDSLAAILTRKKISLTDDLDVVRIDKPKGKIALTVVKTDAPEDGSVTFVFKRPKHKLIEMNVTDANQQTTKVAFADLKMGVTIDNDLFYLSAERDIFGKHRPR